MRERIKSYEEAARFLGQTNSRSTGQRGTWVIRLTPTEIAVRYHQTDVVTYHHPMIADKLATIDCGGWQTKTTAERIKEYAPGNLDVEVTPVGLRLWDANRDSPWYLKIGQPYVIPRENKTQEKGVFRRLADKLLDVSGDSP